MLLRLRRCCEMGKFQKRGLVGGDCAIEVVAPVNKVMVSGKSRTVGGGESICVCACVGRRGVVVGCDPVLEGRCGCGVVTRIHNVQRGQRLLVILVWGWTGMVVGCVSVKGGRLIDLMGGWSVVRLTENINTSASW
jgi:hypothetical protein